MYIKKFFLISKKPEIKPENLLKNIPAKMTLRPDLTLQGLDLASNKNLLFSPATCNRKTKYLETICAKMKLKTLKIS